MITIATQVNPLPKAPTSLALTDESIVPLVESNGTPFAAGSSTVIAQLVAEDPDSNTSSLTYSFIDQSGVSNDNASFNLNPSTGEITVAASADLGVLRTNGLATLSVRVTVANGKTLDKTLEIGVKNLVNEAPTVNSQTNASPDWAVIQDSSIMKYQAYFHDSIANSDIQGSADSELTTKDVDSIFSYAFSDTKINAAGDDFEADNDASLHGIAIITDNAQLSPFDGNWEYQIAGSSSSSSWIALPSISEETPLVLNASTLLRFNPSAGFSGQPGSLEVRLIDSSFGTINDGILTDQSLNSVGG